ncbi:hypothetical protein OCF84_21630 (plasmid) [Shewanella xiamenensis]|uniref:Uncharacterized protein n=1 Tax=Shewanella xiamenensis TaxID=332186 RepID=A0ABT6UDG9_9GAMM|nr:hypothetical protein [Shewanella xiamenensis]MDI5832520.1 hypothetical protein [Shewanella xiamenensis]WHF57861.1 hypothetical protein OCF84_21630 [Shewanella xiamenensis]
MDSKVMYTLGQIARAIWPLAGEIPNDVLSAMLKKPLTGLGLATKKEAFRQADQEQLGLLVCRLPADLADPLGGVPEEKQIHFWLGYYHYFSAIEHAKKFGANELMAAGQALFGDRWQTDLARELDLSDPRRLRQWLSGGKPIPISVWSDICSLLRDRQLTIDSVLRNFADK